MEVCMLKITLDFTPLSNFAESFLFTSTEPRENAGEIAVSSLSRLGIGYSCAGQLKYFTYLTIQRLETRPDRASIGSQ